MLTNAFAANVIDYSEADIYKVKNDEMSKKELEHFLEMHNEYSLQ